MDGITWKQRNVNSRRLAVEQERRIVGLLNVVVAFAIAAVAFTDWKIVANISLGYLYILPLALSALANPLPVTFAIAGVCLILADIFGAPMESFYWRAVHDVIYLAVFLIVGFLVTLIARQRDRLAEETRRQRDEYERDLALASQVQHQVLPKDIMLPDVELAASMQTARLLGGDYYDFFEVSPTIIDVVIADVSGKGAAAALLMPSLAVALRLRAKELEGPAEVIKDLDGVLRQITNSATFVTMFYARYDRSARTMEYASAGHNPPLLLNAATGSITQLTESGPVMGILPDAQYTNTKIPVAAGDILTLYTDGVSEQENTAEEEFSIERLQQIITRERSLPSTTIVSNVCEAVTDFAGPKPQADDLTLIVMKIK
jgi:sigma-B regulation protein RsbU (phosphoserine phosphatase)